MKDICKDLIGKLGGPVAVAALCGITHPAVCKWKRIPERFQFTILSAARRAGHAVDANDLFPKLPPIKAKLKRT